ncbi:MAG: Holliday junction branch migration protein RuvA [Kofleriaceae bacterium]|nr:Holliday junction branch migration protein RuvA [Kofleriaceae bacterium]MBP6841267.1 Holliday junction branch migration protein RuvA [Kofleriaceae bacterium]MBP9207961.1 Holliday junction branch migration protein RuvA [Kofleriaceae bacterium]
MIARLAGTLVDRVGTHVVVDCGGVGYEVVCSGYTLAGLPALGEPVTLRVFTHAQENKIALFGFLEAAERALFDLLITVKNVGPSTAIAILSGGASPRDLAGMIAREEASALHRIKGVGKKTAELLIVELREKCELLLLTWAADGSPRAVMTPAVIRRASSRHPLLDEVAAAMIAMGWKPAEADAAVADLVVGDDATIEPLLRQALRSMPR